MTRPRVRESQSTVCVTVMRQLLAFGQLFMV